MAKVQPEAYRAMNALDKYIADSSVEPLYRELIKVRASQINGCAFCVNHHWPDARKQGATEQQLFLLSVWREAGDKLSDEIKLLMEITEEITLIHQHGLSDAVYEKAITTFGEEKTAQIIMTVISINSWNRIGVSLNMHP